MFSSRMTKEKEDLPLSWDPCKHSRGEHPLFGDAANSIPSPKNVGEPPIPHSPPHLEGGPCPIDKICQVNQTTPSQSRNANPYAAATPLVKRTNRKFVLTKNAIPRGELFTPEDLVKLNYFTSRYPIRTHECLYLYLF